MCIGVYYCSLKLIEGGGNVVWKSFLVGAIFYVEHKVLENRGCKPPHKILTIQEKIKHVENENIVRARNNRDNSSFN